MNNKLNSLVFMVLTASVFGLEIANLQPSQGIIFSGDSEYAGLGSAVSHLGDVNGDGVDDMIIGGCYDCSATGSWIVYVVFGNKNGLSNLDFANWDNTKGFKIIGDYSFYEIEFSISPIAGDINGDGINDIIIGAGDAGESREGIVYVIFGNRNLVGDINLKTGLNSTQGFKIFGSKSLYRFGYSVSIAKDINGDGVDDIVIGEPYFSANTERQSVGAVYVIFGSKGAVNDIILSTGLDSSKGFKVIGAALLDRLGISVSGAGDVNGDSIDDLLIGSFRQLNGGAVIIFGKNGTFSDIDLNVTLGDTTGFQIAGSNKEQFGNCVSAAGDINGDGVDDIMVGANRASALGRDRAGIVYIIYGSKNGFSNINPNALSSNQGFRIFGSSAGTQIGNALGGSMDINRDGIADLIIGESYSTGNAYILYGSKNGEADIDLRTLTSSQGAKIAGASLNDRFGNSVSFISDVNGDGASDIIIGASTATRLGRTFSGAAYLIFGDSLTKFVQIEESSTNTAGIIVGSVLGGIVLVGIIIVVWMRFAKKVWPWQRRFEPIPKNDKINPTIENPQGGSIKNIEEIIPKVDRDTESLKP